MGEIEMEESSDLAHNKSVKINLNTLIASHTKAHVSDNFVAEDEHLPTESVRLISRGKPLHVSKNGEQVYTQLADDDSFTVAVSPQAPPKRVRAGHDDEMDDGEEGEEEGEDDDLKFELPESASRWKRRLYCILHDKLKFPDIVLMAIFSLSGKAWVYTIVWFLLAPVAYRWELGRLYVSLVTRKISRLTPLLVLLYYPVVLIIATGFLLIFMNLGRRKPGELSAYSIFNKDFRELPGTFNADRIDRDIRSGQLPGAFHNFIHV